MQESKTITAYRQQLRERILAIAMHAFARHGVKAVKMDDIARQLSISKRTLYEIYENKEVLLYEGVKEYKSLKDAEFQRMLQKCSTVMDIIVKLYKRKVEEFKNTNPRFYADIEKYPRVRTFLDNDRASAHQQFVSFLDRGVKEGFFRNDLDYELIALSFNATTQYVMANQLYNEYSLEHIMYHLFFVSLRGMCTQKGIVILDDFLSAQHLDV